MIGVNTRSVRFRTTVGAAVALAVLLLVAGLVINQLVASQIRSTADATLLERATDRALLLDRGSDPASLVTVVGEEVVAAVLSPSGDVLASSGSTSPDELANLEVGVNDATLTIVHDSDSDSDSDGDGDDREGSVGERGAGGDRGDGEARGDDRDVDEETLRAAVVEASDGSVVVVASESEQAKRAIGAVRTILLVSGPIVVLIGALVAWTVTGRALAPVHTLRDELDGVIRLSDGSRVGEPGTGDEIEALAVTTNALLDRLESHAVARRRFIADASHELKSPIANARALLETTRPAPAGRDNASHGEADVDAGGGVGASGSVSVSPSAERSDGPSDPITVQLLGELFRLQDLVDDLLFLASTDEGSPSTRTTFDLDDVVFDEAERVSVGTEKEIDASGVQPAQLDADRNEVARAIRNLLENAVRHADRRVSIGIEPEGSDRWAVVVVDDGPGIPAGDRMRVFERFARLDDDRTRADGGTGLGLSIVASIADRNGGSVQVTGPATDGARFELTFPRAGT